MRHELVNWGQIPINSPEATDHEASQRFSAEDWLPDTGALDGSARAMKEIVGRVVGR